MVTILDITKEKNKLIISGLAAALGLFVFFTTLPFVAQIAVIVSAAVFAYLLLSTPSFVQKILAKKKDIFTQTEKQSDASKDAFTQTEEQPNILRDEGYSSEDKEEDKVVPTEEQEKTENNEKKDYKPIEFLPGHIDIYGRPIPDNIATNTKNDCFNVDNIKMSVPDCITFGSQTQQELEQNQKSEKASISRSMQLPSLHLKDMIDVTDAPLQETMTLVYTSNVRTNKGPLLSPDELESHQNADTPNTHINTDSSKLSPAEWLSRYGGNQY